MRQDVFPARLEVPINLRAYRRREAADGGGGTGGCSRLILGGVLDLNEA